MICKWASN